MSTRAYGRWLVGCSVVAVALSTWLGHRFGIVGALAGMKVGVVGMLLGRCLWRKDAR